MLKWGALRWVELRSTVCWLATQVGTLLIWIDFSSFSMFRNCRKIYTPHCTWTQMGTQTLGGVVTTFTLQLHYALGGGMETRCSSMCFPRYAVFYSRWIISVSNIQWQFRYLDVGSKVDFTPHSSAGRPKINLTRANWMHTLITPQRYLNMNYASLELWRSLLLTDINQMRVAICRGHERMEGMNTTIFERIGENEKSL